LGGARVEVYLIKINQFNIARYWGRAKRAVGEVVAVASFSKLISGERRG